MPAVKVRGLVKHFRGADSDALAGLDFEVADGQLFCLLGPNGAGKTTTLSILTTTLSPTGGEVRVAGWDLRGDQAALRRAVGIVFQGPSLDLNLTAEENLRLHAVLYGLYPWRPVYRLMPSAYRRQVEELAGVLDVADILGTRARALSGGTRRKFEIVRALLHRPQVLFLDEPSAGLDPQSRQNLWSYLRAVQAGSGTTLFLTTHYLDEAEQADMVCIIDHGRVVELDRPDRFKARQLGSNGPAARPPTLEEAYLHLLARSRP